MVLRNPKHFCAGEGLEPVTPLDLSKIDSFDQMLKALSNTAFGGRSLGEAADILQQMVKDKSCSVVMTLSGAMTIAKMGLVAAEMIERGWVQAVISTGALLCHGFVETSGRTHFKYDPSMDDNELFVRGYNRVYDTLELEDNLDDISEIVRDILGSGKMELIDRNGQKCSCSHTFTRALGEWLNEHSSSEQKSLLKSCYRQDVPVYIPAFTDSELALDFDIYNRINKVIPFDPFLDLHDYCSRICKADTLAIFTIGGGVPRNWAQQVGPYLDILSKRLDDPSIVTKRFKYGVRICPEPVHWGGLSGCTYSEGISWGKFVPPEEGGRFAEVYCDATIAWPILVKAVMERGNLD